MLGFALFIQRKEPRSQTRNIFAIFSALALVLGFTLASTPSAHAAITCTNLSPAIGEVVTCTGAGAASINIPAGARGVRIVAVGGGGQGGNGTGSSGSGTKGGDGGAGARVVGTFALSDAGALSTQVGAGGAEVGDLGGAGGAFSRVQLGGTDLVIAGGGGGGALGVAAGIGGSGAASGTAEGGDGASSGTSSGGKGGSDGSGGAGGSGSSSSNNGDPGQSYADGGNGGTGGGGTGGYGGAGYGGGGGGGTGTSPNLAGGGAGGSFANPGLLVGTASFGPSAGPQGVGGEGGADGTVDGRGKPGSAGLIEITFLDTLPDSSQVPPPILQQFGLPADGECESGATQEMNWAGVQSGGWGKSWAQWMNDGAGGAVCTRTLMYNPARARWMVEGT